MVTGGIGSGKTTLARHLATARDLPCHHKDALVLVRGWLLRSRDVVLCQLVAIADRPAWALDAGPDLLMPEILSRADPAIWLDPPVVLRVRRGAVRNLRHLGQTRPALPPDNNEWPGIRQVRFLWSVWRRSKGVKAVLAERLAAAVGVVIVCRSWSDTFVQRSCEGAEGLQRDPFRPFCRGDSNRIQMRLDIGAKPLERSAQHFAALVEGGRHHM